MAGEEGKVAVNELRDKRNDHILRDKDTFDL